MPDTGSKAQADMTGDLDGAVEKAEVRDSIQTNVRAFLTMSPWATKKKYKIESIMKPDYFKKHIFVKERVREMVDELQDMVRKEPVSLVHGFRGTGKTTVLRCALNVTEFLGLEKTDSPEDDKNKGEPSSRTRLFRMFRNWLTSRLALPRLDDVMNLVKTVDVLDVLDKWVNDESWALVWASLYGKGAVRDLVKQWVDTSWVANQGVRRALNQSEVIASVEGREVKVLCTATIVVLAAVAACRPGSRTLAVFDDLDQLTCSSLVEDLVTTARDALTILDLTKNLPGSDVSQRLGLIFAMRTRTFRRMQTMTGDYEQANVTTDNRFSPMDVLQQRVRHMKEDLEMVDNGILARLSLLLEILEADKSLRTELQELFNNNYRTFIEHLYDSVVMRYPSFSDDDQVKQIQMLETLYEYQRSSRPQHVQSAEAACVRRFIGDLVFLRIMESSKEFGALKNHEITDTPPHSFGPGRNPRLNLARVTLNYIAMRTREDADKPWSDRLPIKEVLEKVSPLVPGRRSGRTEQIEQVAQCIYWLHGSDNEPTWARAVHIHGITELSVPVLVGAMDADTMDPHSPHVKVTTAGLVYLTRFVTSLDVFVAKHGTTRSRHLCQLLFEDLHPEAPLSFVSKQLSEAVKQLRDCARSLVDFTDSRIAKYVFPSYHAIRYSDLVFDKAFHQERLASSFIEQLDQFRIACRESPRLNDDQKSAVLEQVTGAITTLTGLRDKDLEWRS